MLVRSTVLAHAGRLAATLVSVSAITSATLRPDTVSAANDCSIGEGPEVTTPAPRPFLGLVDRANQTFLTFEPAKAGGQPPTWRISFLGIPTTVPVRISAPASSSGELPDLGSIRVPVDAERDGTCHVRFELQGSVLAEHAFSCASRAQIWLERRPGSPWGMVWLGSAANGVSTGTVFRALDFDARRGWSVAGWEHSWGPSGLKSVATQGFSRYGARYLAIVDGLPHVYDFWLRHDFTPLGKDASFVRTTLQNLDSTASASKVINIIRFSDRTAATLSVGSLTLGVCSRDLELVPRN